MRPVWLRAGGHRVLAVRPDVSQPAACSLDLASLYSRASIEVAAACVLEPVGTVEDGLLALVPEGVPLVTPRGVSGAWLRSRAWSADLAERAAAIAVEVRGAFWREWQRELRRHAGDERLPSDLRTRLRHRAEHALEKWRTATPAARPLPRRVLRHRVHTTLPAARLATGSAQAVDAGVHFDRPLAVIEVRGAVDAWAPAVAWLVHEGYGVVRIGRTTEPIQQAGVVDLASPSGRIGTLEISLLLAARFLVSQSIELQHVAYLTNTPTLLLDAPDPFSGYPVRDDGLFTLKTALDLDTGRVFSPGDLLGEGYFRNLRNCGYRHASAAEVQAAVQEMHGGVVHGWDEHPSQARFRQQVIAAGSALAPRVPHVAKWGPDDGFIGDGRLARWQAERLQ